MTSAQTEPQAVLAATLPTSWREALDAAQALACRLRYLGWADRAKLLDEFLWTEARARLSTDGVTAVINRHVEATRRTHPSFAHATWCTSIVTGMLLLLDEPMPVKSAEHALTLLLSRQAEHRRAVEGWLAETTPAELQAALSRLPGYAFLLLTMCPNDTAESFMARDAFWSAMLG